jgi:hypothetical protein
MPFFKRYLNIIVFLACWNLPLSIIGTFFDFREATTYLVLIIGLGLDSLIIALNIKRVRFNFFELVLIVLLILSSVIGIINNASLDRRMLTDLLNPLFFVLKITIFRRIIFFQGGHAFLNEKWRYYGVQLFKFSFITVILFLVLSQIRTMYAGIGLTTHPFLVHSLQSSSFVSVFFTFIVVLLTGKRALIISSIILVLVYMIFVKRNLVKTCIFSVVLLLAIYSIDFKSLNISAIDKYTWTYELYLENDVQINLEDDNEYLDAISGGRMCEITGATSKMRTLDYIIGRGIGFTYEYTNRNDDEFFPKYANLHFTPLSIITKYGLIFFAVLALYILHTLGGFRNSSALRIFFGLYVIGVSIDSLFAYVIFVDPLIPIALGYLSFNKYPNTGKRVEKS